MVRVVAFMFFAAVLAADVTEQFDDGVKPLRVSSPIISEEDFGSQVMPSQYKCDACRAVMFQLNIALQAKHPKGRKMHEWEYIELFEDVCQNSFQSYGITSVDGENRLSGPGIPWESRGGTMVTSGEVSWARRLSAACQSHIFDKFGEDAAYALYQKEQKFDTSACSVELKECTTLGPAWVESQKPLALEDEGTILVQTRRTATDFHKSVVAAEPQDAALVTCEDDYQFLEFDVDEQTCASFLDVNISEWDVVSGATPIECVSNMACRCVAILTTDELVLKGGEPRWLCEHCAVIDLPEGPSQIEAAEQDEGHHLLQANQHLKAQTSETAEIIVQAEVASCRRNFELAQYDVSEEQCEKGDFSDTASVEPECDDQGMKCRCFDFITLKGKFLLGRKIITPRFICQPCVQEESLVQIRNPQFGSIGFGGCRSSLPTKGNQCHMQFQDNTVFCRAEGSSTLRHANGNVNYQAYLAVDGQLAGGNHGFFHSSLESYPWLKISFMQGDQRTPKPMTVTRVEIYQRCDATELYHQTNFDIRGTDDQETTPLYAGPRLTGGKICSRNQVQSTGDTKFTFPCRTPIEAAKEIWIQKTTVPMYGAGWPNSARGNGGGRRSNVPVSFLMINEVVVF